MSDGWLKSAGDRVVAWAARKGWEPDPNRTFGDECALLHSEVSEALEAYRRWGVTDQTPDPTYREFLMDQPLKPEGVASEFADVLIRLLHYSNVHGFDLEAEFERKMRYNETRAWRHGGRAL